MANRYRVVRVRPNGNETVVQDFAVANNASLTTEQSQRAAAFTAARNTKASNPSWRLRIYSPNPSTSDQVAGDCVWDSEVQP